MTVINTGKLASGLINAQVYTPVYTVPALTSAVVTLRAVNCSEILSAKKSIKFRVLISSTTPPVNGDLIIADDELAPGDTFVLSDLKMSAGESVIVYAEYAGLAGRIDGEESDANSIVPRVTSVSSGIKLIGWFTDNGDTTGYADFATNLPAGAVPIGCKVTTAIGFTGDTTAVVQIGVAGDLDRFSSVTDQSVFAGGVVGFGVPVDACDGIGVEQTPRITVTGGADFGSIAAGAMLATLYYIDTT